jgi:hypothetical protein
MAQAEALSRAPAVPASALASGPGDPRAPADPHRRVRGPLDRHRDTRSRGA